MPVLQQISVNQNVHMSTAPSLETLKPFSPLVVELKRETAFGLAPAVRPRVGSTARRTAHGWTKRGTGKSSTDQKENAVGQGSVISYVSSSFGIVVLLNNSLLRPGENLRLSRPRPRGRPTPASQQRIVRI